ncbi:MAG TPA: hypothetical protein VK636_04540 [Gemmatimonadaceae bacterium]|nr:hypothetical protein [Gemmatimonadaceae bacterium]
MPPFLFEGTVSAAGGLTAAVTGAILPADESRVGGAKEGDGVGFFSPSHEARSRLI